MADTVWNNYRKNRLILFLLVIGWPPLGIGVNWLQARLGFPDFILWSVLTLWILFVIVQGTRVAIWPCPNCGRPFRGMLPFLPKQCRHCNQPR
jgi:hypothetical protein